MKYKFSVGQKAVIVGLMDKPERNGLEVTVTGIRNGIPPSAHCYFIDAEPTEPGKMVVVIRETNLRPIYDGHEPCAFDESIWSPIKESVT